MFQSNWENKCLKSSPVFKGIRVFRQLIRLLMQKYAEREGLSTKPRWMLFSRFALKNGTVIIPLIFFIFRLGSIMHRNIPVRWVPSRETVQRFCATCCWRSTTRRRKSNFPCFAETMKLLATFPLFNKSWTVVIILSQVNWMMRKRTQQSAKNCSRD